MQQQSMTKLPSIQAMLEGISISEASSDRNQLQQQSSINHRRHASEHSSAFIPVDSVANSMHGRLEKLSIQQPTPIEPRLQDHPVNSSNTSNSSLRDILPFSTRISHLQNHHHSPRNLHSRSYSDYTHPYPSSSPPRVSGAKLAPLHPTFHRRAVSTNTLDFILQPLMQRPLDQYNAPPQLYASSSTASTVTNAPYSPTNANEEGGYTSDESNTSTTRSTTSATVTTISAAVGSNNKAILPVTTTTHQEQPDRTTSASPILNTTAATTATNPSTLKSSTSAAAVNKYNCPYCDKTFSRPSSLQIHTYSHTGERPFECPEIGCSRKFSVQSNMRRHLRVHRLGRPLKRNGGPITPADRAQLINKPLAAKPLPANWIGVTVLTHHSPSHRQEQQQRYPSYS